LASHDQPPIITLAESKGYYFALGSAELSTDFLHKLQGPISENIYASVRKYNVDMIEVVGHTDEVPVSGKSTLDKALIPYITGEGQDIAAGDNVGLGMARAATVVNVLRKDSRFRDLKIVPYSAGQVVLPNNTIADGSDPSAATHSEGTGSWLSLVRMASAVFVQTKGLAVLLCSRM
jgi:outer membrane protein OmpA-like peptidoglycan-associated protein